jgi:hypothetical protein
VKGDGVAEEASLAALVRCVDALEAVAEWYVTLDEVRHRCRAGADPDVVDAALDDDLLLVDERRRLDRASGALLPVTLCRLNRRHPLVRQLLAW